MLHAILTALFQSLMICTSRLASTLVCDRRRAAMLDSYDLVLLDEAHECTEAQISLIESPSKRSWSSILVYDCRQRLYAWRHAASELYRSVMSTVDET